MPNFSQKSLNQKGYFFVICSAILWAISGSASKFLFIKGITAFQLVQIRTSLACVVLFFWLIITNPLFFKNLNKKDFIYFFILGAVGMASVQFTYLLAISKINVSIAILLQYQAPIIIAFYAFIFGKQKINKFIIIAILGAILGCYFVVGAYKLDILSMNKIGILSSIFAAISFAFYSVYGEYGMKKHSSELVIFFAFLFAAIAWNTVLHEPFEVLKYENSKITWFWMIYIAVFGTALPFGLYFKGIKIISATHASLTAMLEPITACFISYIFLNEKMELLQIFGAILVILSILALQNQEFLNNFKYKALIKKDL